MRTLSTLLVVLLPVACFAVTLELEPLDIAVIISEPNDEGIAEARLLVQFDLSPLPEGAGILVGDIAFAIAQDLEASGQAALVMAPLTHAWSPEDVSWDGPSADAEWEEPGGDYDASLVAHKVWVSTLPHIRFPVTSLIREWATGERMNFGVVIKPASEDEYEDAFGLLTSDALGISLGIEYRGPRKDEIGPAER